MSLFRFLDDNSDSCIRKAAAQSFAEALELLQSLDEPFSVAECFIGVAGVFLHLDKQQFCVQTLSAARAMLVSLDAQEQIDPVDQTQYDRIYAKTKHNMDQSQWQAAWDAGQTIGVDQVVAKVLQELRLDAR